MKPRGERRASSQRAEDNGPTGGLGSNGTSPSPTPETIGGKAERLRLAGRCIFVSCEDRFGNIRSRPYHCNPDEIQRVREKLDDAGIVFDRRDFTEGDD